jgi:hypothetical protein
MLLEGQLQMVILLKYLSLEIIMSLALLVAVK